MAFLRVHDGTDWLTVPVAYPDGAEETIEPLGDQERSAGGNMLSSIRADLPTLPITTHPMLPAPRDALLAALRRVARPTFDGDLLGGSRICGKRLLSNEPVAKSADTLFVVRFELLDY